MKLLLPFHELLAPALILRGVAVRFRRHVQTRSFAAERRELCKLALGYCPCLFDRHVRTLKETANLFSKVQGCSTLQLQI